MGFSVARRRLALAGCVLDQPRAGFGPSPAELRNASSLGARAIEPARGADARERDGGPGLSNAVSLQVQPQLVLALREALARAGGIKAAFLYGSVATAQEGPQSDVDLMVIGDDVTYADCCFGLLNAEHLLKRRIHAHFVSPAEWKRKLRRRSAFVARVNAQPRIFIFGSAEDLRR